MTWPAVLVLAGGTYLLKASGLFAGGRLTSPRATAVIGLLPVALLSALVVVQTLGGEAGLVPDARIGGVAVAAVAVWRRAQFGLVVVLGIVVTAGFRALGLP